MNTAIEMGAVLEVKDLCKSYGPLVALDRISFTLRVGESLGVLGPSGSGKSTLIRSIDILEPFNSGTVTYFGSTVVTADSDGMEVTNQKGQPGNLSDGFREIRKNVGVVFQHLNLWENRTVLENLTLAPRVVLGQEYEIARAEAMRLCERFGLTTKISSRIWQLSGGQRQRVAILRALMMKPRVLLLDEVTSALDPSLVVDVMDAIRTLRAEGIAFVLVTHHLEFACATCDRLLFIQDGRILLDGPPDEFRRNDIDPRVKEFCRILKSAV